MKNFIQLCFILLVKLSLAQDPYSIIIDKSRGLPSNAVYHVFQDSKGFIWVATDEGLARYDGYEFKSYTNATQSSKAGTEIHEDKFGRIWYQNFDGFLFYVEHDSLKSLSQNPPVGYLHFGIIDDKLFVTQQKGVDIFNLTTLKLEKTILLNSKIFSGTQQSRTHFYILAYNLYKISTDGSMSTVNMPLLSHAEYPGLMQSDSKELFLVSRDNTHKQCYQIDNDKVTPKFSLNDVNLIQNTSYADKFYWFCTTAGVYAYDESGNSKNNNQAFFKDKFISSVLKDREGNYWFSTTNSGLLFVPNLETKLFTTDYKPYKTAINKDVLYVGTKNSELYSYELNTHHSTLLYKENSNLVMYNVNYDTTQQQILFTALGFKILDHTGKQVFDWGGALKDLKRIDDKYFALAASGFVGLLTINEKLKSPWDSTVFNHKDTVTNFLCGRLIVGVRGKSIAYSSEDSIIYSATSNGLYAIDFKETNEIKEKNKTVYISTLQQYRHQIFAITDQGVIYEIQQKKLIHSSVNEQLKDKIVKTIKIRENYLFFITETELFSKDLSKPESPINKVNVNLQYNEISDITIWKDKLILITSVGLLISDLKQIESRDNSPRFVINELKVNGKSHTFNQQFTLNANEDNIEINYSILSFKTESKYPLYYKINNHDWELALPESRSLKLVSLSPGQYKVQFKLGDKLSNKVVASISFKINKHWYLRNGLLVLSLLLVSLAIYTYYKWQIALLNKRNALLSEKMELEKNLNSSMLTSIKSQMNPHFFYNALNTIQSFIFTDDKKNASNYLAKFSKLTRMILEFSEKEFITLQEEMNALTLYLEIEKVRFNDDFDFLLKVDPHIQTDLVKIPSMLIQPYVENAIKHGLLHHRENKILTIMVVLQDNNLIVTIEDNGIGRKRSEELNKIRRDKHESFSSDANKKRLEILNQGKSNKTLIKYIDKTDQAGQATGTIVIISIPIN